MLSFPARIELSYQTLQFLTPKIEKIGREVEKTEDAVKLKKMLGELAVLSSKFEREKNIIDQLIKEAGVEESDLTDQ